MAGYPLELRDVDTAAAAEEPHVHRLARGICGTEDRGYETPGDRSPLELIVNAPNGYIPLWAPNCLLRYRFQERSFAAFSDPDGMKGRVRGLFNAAIAAWGDAAPVRFRESQDLWDFEFSLRPSAQCSASGCVLASAFFPDGGQHELTIYPTLFEQTEREQVETLIHETGHVFGLRHFFALVSETAWPAQVFGTQNKFTIMNYGAESVLTDADKSDLRTLYQQVWSGQLLNINRTPIRLVRPFSSNAP